MSSSTDSVHLLVPTPRHCRRLPGHWAFPGGRALTVECGGQNGCESAFELLVRALAPHEVRRGAPARSGGIGSAGSAPDLCLRVAGSSSGPASGSSPGDAGPDQARAAQGYRLRVRAEGIEIEGASEAGLFYGVCTLLQLLGPDRWGEAPRGAHPLRAACVEIEDAPAFARRGVMLDVSRDRVPTMATLRAAVEAFSRWKFNELQLYTEHTFAYRGHEVVWSDASPLRVEEIRELAALCRARHIDLVPNQQSLGHFHRWLVHGPYRALAECPDGVEHPFSREVEPFSLSPTSPAALDFVKGLHLELQECFDSDFVNVGLDETFDIGQGASAGAVLRSGKGRVYLAYLLELHGFLARQGKRMQFWGDVILEHPELVPDLPRDALALEWGYEAGHPFEEHAARFAEAGLDFYVCPGTSSWQSLAGRLGNARQNLREAARAGQAAGARGLLVTDWGDFGHLQPLPVSFGPLLLAASRAWNPSGEPPPLAAALDRHLFGRAVGTPGSPSLGAVWTALGELDGLSGARSSNGSPLFFLLRFAHEAWPHARIEGLTEEGLERTRAAVEGIRARLDGFAADDRESALVLDEGRWLCDALEFACRLGVERLRLGAGHHVSDLEPETRARLGSLWAKVREGLPGIWLVRSRPGGLADALGRFAALTEGLGVHGMPA